MISLISYPWEKWKSFANYSSTTARLVHGLRQHDFRAGAARNKRREAKGHFVQRVHVLAQGVP